MKRVSRSEKYQHMFNEVRFDPFALRNFTIEQPEEYDDRKACLRDTLKDHFWRLIDCHTTGRNREDDQ